MTTRLLIGGALLAALAAGFPAIRAARAGACIQKRCTCDDDCAAPFKCNQMGAERLCCNGSGLPPIACQAKRDGAATDGATTGGTTTDGGGDGGGSSDGCGLLGAPGRHAPAWPLAAVAMAGAIRAYRRCRR